MLDLYQRRWEGAPLGRPPLVLAADENTSIQARIRIHPALPAAPGRHIRIEREYQRAGACAYLAAWDVHRAKLFGRCVDSTGIVPFDRLVEQVMSVEPYRCDRCAPFLPSMPLACLLMAAPDLQQARSSDRAKMPPSNFNGVEDVVFAGQWYNLVV